MFYPLETPPAEPEDDDQNADKNSENKIETNGTSSDWLLRMIQE